MTGVLTDVRSVLLVHAHPDDETLSTGALTLELVARGIVVRLVTATRGERGGVVPGPLSALAGTEELTVVRSGELDAAARALGIARRFWLGEPPALAPGAPPRRYLDSGMEWIAPGLAGPARDVDPRAFTSVPLEQPVADLTALLGRLRPDLVISYDDGGGYGHPDHVRAYQVSRAACRAAGVPFRQVVTRPGPGAHWFTLEQHLPALTAALRCYPSQLTVDGTDVVHCGGQREAIVTSVGLRRV